MKFVTDSEVIRLIIEQKNRYIPWIGAGFSVEAGVKTTRQICDNIRASLLNTYGLGKSDPSAVDKWVNENLDWDDAGKRYLTCIKQAYPNEALRNEFFHKLLLDAQPSLSHYTLALLMSNGYFRSTCFTTNFDHLIEYAFTHQDIGGVQAIRTDEECSYWQNIDNRRYVVKLHGDTDTLNVANTREETLELSEAMIDLIEKNSHNVGLVVMGTAGNEKSIRKVIEKLGQASKKDRSVWSFGVLWGVYMGSRKPADLSKKELEKLIEQRVSETEVNQDIVDFIQDSQKQLFSFFPMWGAGKFMFDLVEAARNYDQDLRAKEILSKASRYLDHEMRLHFIYTNAGLTDDAIEQHLRNLRQEREKLDKAGAAVVQQSDIILRAKNTRSDIEVRAIYGDITDRNMMLDQEFENCRKAVISPEDTCISAGGGVAYRLLLKAGQKTILNELAKFSPIPQNTVAVTSGGNLPVHYIVHAASLKIEKDASYTVDKQNVKSTMTATLDKLRALDVNTVWTPLLAAGAASLKPIDSYEAILESIHEYSTANQDNSVNPLTIIIVIYQEKVLPRNFVFDGFNRILGSTFQTVIL